MTEPAALQWRDLRSLSRTRRMAELLLPLPWLLLALAAAFSGWIGAALAATALFFTAGLRLTHDLYHRNLGLDRRSTNGLLFLLSVLLGGALHAIEYTHLQHHRRCLAEDDLEGRIGHLGFWQALWRSPIYPVLIHLHTLRHGSRRQRHWVQVELVAVALVQALIWASSSTALQCISLALLLANAAVPMVGIWSVHRDTAHQPHRARSIRWRWLDAPTFNMLYHLEHHRFPAVPACRLPELARRIAALERPSSSPLSQQRQPLRFVTALALLALLAGCRHRLAAVPALDACAIGLPVVAETLSYPLALPGRRGDGVAGDCQFRRLERAGDAAQIQLSLFTDAAAGERPLEQTFALILAEAGNTFGPAQAATLGTPGPQAALFENNGEPAQIVVADRGLILTLGLHGLPRERALRLAQQLWQALERHRPSTQR